MMVRVCQLKKKLEENQSGLFYREDGSLYLITGVGKLADGLEIRLDGLPPIWRHPDDIVWVETQSLRNAFGKVNDV